MTQIQITSFLVNLIDAINNVRECENESWYQAPHFQALKRCLDEAHGLLHFQLTRAPTQQENQLKVSPDVGQRRVTRQTTAKLMKRKISLPDEVLKVIFSYFKDSFHNPRNLSSNAYNFSLVCKSWFREANQRLWQNVHLSSKKSAILFARSLYERHQSPTRAKGPQWSIGDGIRCLHVHYEVDICFPASYTYVFECVKLYTKNIVSLDLKGLSTHLRPMKITEFYEIAKFHPYLKHVWLCHVDIDSVEPLDPLPQFETFDCPILWGPDDMEALELISAKAISIYDVSVFKKDAVKSVYCEFWSIFLRQVHEYKQVTHLHLHLVVDDDEEGNEFVEGFSHVVKLPNLSFLILDNSTCLTSNSFDLIAKHFSLTTFIITWQPSMVSVVSWISAIKKMGPKLLSVGVGLDEDEHRNHPHIFRAIYENCPNLMTLELYFDDPPSHPWTLHHASELEKLCLLPLKWIYAPWFEEWPQNSKDRSPKFSRLCRLGLNVGLKDFSVSGHQLFDYTQPMRPAIIGDG